MRASKAMLITGDRNADLETAQRLGWSRAAQHELVTKIYTQPSEFSPEFERFMVAVVEAKPIEGSEK